MAPIEGDVGNAKASRDWLCHFAATPGMTLYAGSLITSQSRTQQTIATSSSETSKKAMGAGLLEHGKSKVNIHFSSSQDGHSRLYTKPCRTLCCLQNLAKACKGKVFHTMFPALPLLKHYVGVRDQLIIFSIHREVCTISAVVETRWLHFNPFFNSVYFITGNVVIFLFWNICMYRDVSLYYNSYLQLLFLPACRG